MARLVAGAPWRYPGCRPEHTKDHGWLIRLDGPGEAVLPRGVGTSGEVGDRALLLDTSVDDAFLSLERVRRLDDEAAAEALAEHARAHPISRFLCHHGLPMWHRGPDPCRMLMDLDGTPCITLSHVRTMMDGLSGLQELACHTTRSQPAQPAQVAAALQWHVLPDYIVKPARAETERDGELFVGRCRQLVTLSLRYLHDTALLRRDIEWVENDQLQLVSHAHTDLGLYLYAFVARMLQLTNRR